MRFFCAVAETITPSNKSPRQVRRGASLLRKQLTSLKHTPGRSSVHTLRRTTGTLRRFSWAILARISVGCAAL